MPSFRQKLWCTGLHQEVSSDVAELQQTFEIAIVQGLLDEAKIIDPFFSSKRTVGGESTRRCFAISLPEITELPVYPIL